MKDEASWQCKRQAGRPSPHPRSSPPCRFMGIDEAVSPRAPQSHIRSTDLGGGGASDVVQPQTIPSAPRASSFAPRAGDRPPADPPRRARRHRARERAGARPIMARARLGRARCAARLPPGDGGERAGPPPKVKSVYDGACHRATGNTCTSSSGLTACSTVACRPPPGGRRRAAGGRAREIQGCARTCVHGGAAAATWPWREGRDRRGRRLRRGRTAVCRGGASGPLGRQIPHVRRWTSRGVLSPPGSCSDAARGVHHDKVTVAPLAEREPPLCRPAANLCGGASSRGLGGGGDGTVFPHHCPPQPRSPPNRLFSPLRPPLVSLAPARRH